MTITLSRDPSGQCVLEIDGRRRRGALSSRRVFERVMAATRAPISWELAQTFVQAEGARFLRVSLADPQPLST